MTQLNWANSAYNIISFTKHNFLKLKIAYQEINKAIFHTGPIFKSENPASIILVLINYKQRALIAPEHIKLNM